MTDYLQRRGESHEDEAFALITLACLGAGRFNETLSSPLKTARGILLAERGRRTTRNEMLAQALGTVLEQLWQALNELELWLLSAGEGIWGDEASEYLEVMEVRLPPCEAGANRGDCLLEAKRLFSRWFADERAEVAANALIVVVQRALNLVSYERRRLLENNEMEEWPHERTDGESPRCPLCEAPMRLRTAKNGKKAGQRFWGCTRYPECRGTREID